MNNLRTESNFLNQQINNCYGLNFQNKKPSDFKMRNIEATTNLTSYNKNDELTKLWNKGNSSKVSISCEKAKGKNGKFTFCLSINGKETFQTVQTLKEYLSLAKKLEDHFEFLTSTRVILNS